MVGGDAHQHQLGSIVQNSLLHAQQGGEVFQIGEHIYREHHHHLIQRDVLGIGEIGAG